MMLLKFNSIKFIWYYKSFKDWMFWNKLLFIAVINTNSWIMLAFERSAIYWDCRRNEHWEFRSCNWNFKGKNTFFTLIANYRPNLTNYFGTGKIMTSILLQETNMPMPHEFMISDFNDNFVSVCQNLLVNGPPVNPAVSNW